MFRSTSLSIDPRFPSNRRMSCARMFYGLGSDGTVGANKESIKIIGENTEHFAQGYFVYDSKKSGAMTISHLRFGPRPIRSTYLVTSANFVACHQPFLLERYDVLEELAPGGTFLLNSPFGPDQVWAASAGESAAAADRKRARISSSSTQTRWRASAAWAAASIPSCRSCFFAISGVLPREEAIAAIKDSIRKSYAKKGEEIVQMNLRGGRCTPSRISRSEGARCGSRRRSSGRNGRRNGAPVFVRKVLGAIIAGRGDDFR